MSTAELKPEKFGRYLLLDRINVGGMAEVFRGKMQGVEGFERMVALKRILPNVSSDPDFIEMFIDEAKLAVQLQHANIAQIYDLGKQSELYYIAMEYVSGVDLRTMWDRARQRNRLLPIAMSCYIVQKACEGLDAAHRKRDDRGNDIGLVHRDVSPHNILVSYEGEVKVIDFGIAKSKSKISKTQAGILKGKFGYMSPEQVRGMELDNRSDVFACGVVLYEMVVGDRLFLGESDFSTLEKVRNVEMIPPTRLNKNLSPALERIILKALAKSRDDRYRWASEMAEDIQRYLFSTNQPFARTDLQKYLAQHFQQEQEEEKERLERYREITFEQFASVPSEPAGSRVKPARRLQPAPAAADAQDDGDLDDMADEVDQLGEFDTAPNVSATHPLEVVNPVAPPPGTPAASGGAKLPSWLAAVLGALVAIIVVALGLVVYLLKSASSPGSIALEVTPPQADIYLNETLVQHQAPVTIDNLPPGAYVITVKKEGYAPLVRTFVVASGEARMESLVLEPKKSAASIILRSSPNGLEIYLDSKNTGRRTPATLVDVEPGEHLVSLRRGEVTIHREVVKLTEGAAELREVDLAKLPTIVEVSSVPPGAKVSVDGEPKGQTPQSIAVTKPGAIQVVVEQPGCERYESKLTPERPSISSINATLACGVANH